MAALPEQSAEDQARETKLDDGSVKVKLHKNVRALDEVLTEMTFREPDAGDLYDIGNPVKIVENRDGQSVVEVDDQRMLKMISRLSEPHVPMGSVRKMKLSDVINCSWALAPFFIPRPPPR